MSSTLRMDSSRCESLEKEDPVTVRGKSGILSKSPASGVSSRRSRVFSIGSLLGSPHVDTQAHAPSPPLSEEGSPKSPGTNRSRSTVQQSPSVGNSRSKRSSFADFLSGEPLDGSSRTGESISIQMPKDNQNFRFSGTGDLRSTFSDTWKRSTAEPFGMFKFPQKEPRDVPPVAEDNDAEVLLRTSPRKKTSSWRLQRRRSFQAVDSWQYPELEGQKKDCKEMTHSDSKHTFSEADVDEEDIDPGWCINLCITKTGRSYVSKWTSVTFAFLFVLLGLMAAGLTCYKLYEKQTKTRAEKIAFSCSRFGQKIEAQLGDELTHLQDLTEVISTFYYGINDPPITGLHFAAYMNRTQANRFTSQALVYAERVNKSSRPAFEKLTQMCIKNINGNCSSMKPEYAPTLFEVANKSSDVQVINYPRGLDTYSVPILEGPLERARDLGVQGALSEPIMRAGMPNDAVMIHVYPVYVGVYPTMNTTEEFRKLTRGYFIGSFNFSDNVEHVFRTKISLLEPIVGLVQDVTNRSNPILIWMPHEVSNKHHFTQNVTLHLGDPARKYRLLCDHKPDGWFPWPAVYFPIIIVLIVMITTYIVHTGVRGVQRMGRDYWRQRTLKEKMAEAKGAAESASRAKGAFLATMSHEIRTPMNGVIGMLNLLLDTTLDATQLDYVETARSSGRALCALINDVLDLSKIESGHMELERIPFSLGNEIDDVLSMFAEKAREKADIELASLVQDGVPSRLLGDPLRFRQVLINLIGNAFKFTKKGHIFVTVRLAGPDEDLKNVAMKSPLIPPALQCPLSREGFEGNADEMGPKIEDLGEHLTLSGKNSAKSCNSWDFIGQSMVAKAPYQYSQGDTVRLVISCEDTGVGIPPWAFTSIFKPFTQADTSTTRLHGGTGIGLTICQRLVNMMGGNLTFASRLGVGTTFFFDCFLEVAEGGQAAGTPGVSKEYPIGFKPFKGRNGPPAPSPVPQPVSCPSPPLSPLEDECQRVLVVDHRPVRRAVIGWHLRRLGLQVDFCDSPDTAGVILGSSEASNESSRSSSAEEGALAFSPSPVSPPLSPRKYSGGREYCAVFVDGEEVGLGIGVKKKEDIKKVVEKCHQTFGPGARQVGSANRPPLVLLSRVRGEEEDARKAGFEAVLLKPLRRGSVSACLVQLFSGVGLARTSSGGLVARQSGANTPAGKSSKEQTPHASFGKATEGARTTEPSTQKNGLITLQDKGGPAASLSALFTGMRVLVVDDNMVNRKVISRMLQRYGAIPEQVESGFSAIESLREGHSFNLVFMDVQMPSMDGYEATQEIRRLEAEADPSGKLHVPIFALTADIVVGTREKCTKSGMDGFLSKPIEEDQLFRVLLPFFDPSLSNSKQ